MSGSVSSSTRNRRLQRADDPVVFGSYGKRVRRERLGVLRLRRFDGRRRALRCGVNTLQPAKCRERHAESRARLRSTKTRVGLSQSSRPTLASPQRPARRHSTAGRFGSSSRRAHPAAADSAAPAAPDLVARRRPHPAHNARRGTLCSIVSHTDRHSSALTRPLRPRSATISTSRSASST